MNGRGTTRLVPTRRALALALVAGAVGGLGCGPVTAAVAEGWYEIDRSENAAAPSTATPAEAARPASVGRGGDRFWMTRAGDTYAAIARETTGSASDAEAIARYNGMAPDAALAPDTLLFVPAALLPPAHGADRAPSWEIREFGAAGSDAAVRLAEPAAERTGERQAERGGERVVDGVAIPARTPDEAPVPAVRRRNVDLFAGEVEVLGEFDVTRVAIGNGAIVRAEVLATGELLVIAQSAGSTSLRLWHKDGGQSDFNLRVSERDPETRVRMERMVRMRVRMVEFRKTALGRLGIRWSEAADGPTFAAAGDAVGNALFRPQTNGFGTLPNAVKPFSTYFGLASNITSRINFFASNGDATTLAEPVLSAVSGGNASFLAGGEVPYPSVGANGQTAVQFKEYGIRLDVSPIIDDAGNVRTVVRTEISQIDEAVTVQGAPGLLTRRAETEVNVRSGETIVISGLLSAESGKAIERVPGLGRLPVIGSLFRSRDVRDSVSELVIFVTPEVIEPGGAELGVRERRVRDAADARLERARDSLPLME